MVTFVGALLGIAVAAVIHRRASQPRRTFTRTTWTLAVLVVEHLVAAAIVIPRIASRLPR